MPQIDAPPSLTPQAPVAHPDAATPQAPAAQSRPQAATPAAPSGPAAAAPAPAPAFRLPDIQAPRHLTPQAQPPPQRAPAALRPGVEAPPLETARQPAAPAAHPYARGGGSLVGSAFALEEPPAAEDADAPAHGARPPSEDDVDRRSITQTPRALHEGRAAPAPSIPDSTTKNTAGGAQPPTASDGRAAEAGVDRARPAPPQASTPAARLHEAVNAARGTHPAGGPGATPLPLGKSMPLNDVLMQAPVMTQGKGDRQKTVDQKAAALATAQNALGIDDPENVHVTPATDGTYSLSRAGAAGTGPGPAMQPFARVDPQNNRITLVPGPDGSYSQAALDLAAKSTPHGMPVYLPGGEPPLSPAEVGSLMEKGQQATGTAQDRTQADAALTQAGLSPEGIGRLVQQGRLSVQDGKLLNDKFNGGVTSYATRQAGEAAQQQEAGLQQMYEGAKGTPEQPNFQSWMDRGDPQRDAQVQARAKELGVSEDALRRDLETRRVLDWSTPLTQQSHDLQSGLTYGLGRKLGFIDRAEPTRMLPDGSIMPNPELGGDRAEFDAAIAGSHGSEEAKARARGQWDRYHDNYLTNVRPSLETMETLPGVENYTAWRERVQEEGKVAGFSENQKAEMYMQEQKGRDGFVKFLDNVSSNLLAGSHDLVAGIAGTAGLLTGSQTASEYAAEKSGEARRTTEALQHTGNDGLVDNIVGGVTRALPGLAATVASGGAVGTATKGAGLFLNAASAAKVARLGVNAATAFTQGAGSTYAELYQHHLDRIKDDLSPEEAHQAAHQAARGSAAASGAFSAALGGIFSGGANALNNPATRDAAKKTFGSAMKSFLKGTVDEVPQEMLDSGFSHIEAEMNKGATVQEAAQSFMTNLPETMATAGALGGTVQTGAHLAEGRGGGAPAPAPMPAQLPPLQEAFQPQHVDPAADPMAAGDSRQPPFTVAAVDGPDVPAPAPAPPGGAPIKPIDVEGQTVPGQPAPAAAGGSPSSPQPPPTPFLGQPAPPSTEPVPAPAATLEKAREVLDRVAALQAKKTKDGKLSLEEEMELDHSEKVVAITQVTNLEEEQRVIGGLEKPRELDPYKTKALAAAKAVLARPAPGAPATTATSSSSGSLAPGASATTAGVAAPTGMGITPATGGDGSGHGAAASTSTGIPETSISDGRRRVDGDTAPAGRRRGAAATAAALPGGNRSSSPPLAAGTRSNGNPQHLVLAPVGAEGGLISAAAQSLVVEPPQAASAVGTVIDGPAAANPDAPTNSAGGHVPAPSLGGAAVGGSTSGSSQPLAEGPQSPGNASLRKAQRPGGEAPPAGQPAKGSPPSPSISHAQADRAQTVRAREQAQQSLAQHAIQSILSHDDTISSTRGRHSNESGRDAEKSRETTRALLGTSEGTIPGWAGAPGQRKRGEAERAYLTRQATPPTDKGVRFGEGGEHHVYHRPGEDFVTKATHSGNYGQVLDQMGPEEGYRFNLRPASPSEYLTRLALTNNVFGDDIKVAGYERTPEGPSIITTQPLMEGPHPKKARVEAFLRRNGFAPMDEKLYDNKTINPTKRPWYRPSDGVVVVDAKPQNFVLHNGKVTPVDLMIQLVPDAVMNATRASRQR